MLEFLVEGHMSDSGAWFFFALNHQCRIVGVKSFSRELIDSQG